MRSLTRLTAAGATEVLQTEVLIRSRLRAGLMATGVTRNTAWRQAQQLQGAWWLPSWPEWNGMLYFDRVKIQIENDWKDKRARGAQLDKPYEHKAKMPNTPLAEMTGKGWSDGMSARCSKSI
eukprot:1161761-Pelagomonas_calceolata.AAC.3